MILHDHFDINTKGHLTIGGLDTVDLAKEFGTPAYIMDESALRKMCRTYREAAIAAFGADALPLYASKAFSCREVYRIAAEEGRDATVGELAVLVGVSREEAATALDALSPVASLSDNAYGEDSPELESRIADQADADDMARRMDALALTQVINTLPSDWRKIVLLRYYRNMTQQQVANLMGLTQVKVSREEKKIMAYMREQLGG